MFRFGVLIAPVNGKLLEKTGLARLKQARLEQAPVGPPLPPHGPFRALKGCQAPFGEAGVDGDRL